MRMSGGLIQLAILALILHQGLKKACKKAFVYTTQFEVSFLVTNEDPYLP